MIDRDQLTEARQKVGKIRILTQGIARDATYLTVALNRLDWAAEQLLDFPTDEQVEAAAVVFKNGVFGKTTWRQLTAEALEAATMIGDNRA